MSRRVVKQKKHTEHYQREKLHTSIHRACMSVREAAGSAELTAENVCNQIEQWLENKVEVTSYDLRLASARFLQQYNPSAALVYVAHMEVN